MSGEPYNEIVYKAAEKIIAGSGGTAANPSAVVGNVAAGAADSGDPVKAGGVYLSALPTLTTGNRGNLQLDVSGNLRSLYVSAISTGIDGIANQLGYATPQSVEGVVLSAQAPHKFNGTTWDRDVKPNAVSRVPSSAADTNPTLVKASAGNVFSINGYNSSATVTYLKLYRKATAPTVGTDTPFMTLALPALTPFEFSFDSLYFTTGIGFGLTTDAADAGTTAVAAGAILGLNVAYS